jgi:hypothetical protein
MNVRRCIQYCVPVILCFCLIVLLAACGDSTGDPPKATPTPTPTPTPAPVSTVAQQWTWISGSDTSNASGVYGTLGVPAAGNVPGARFDSVSWTDAGGNLWLFGGQYTDCDPSNDCMGSLRNDLWEFNPASSSWTWISGSDTSNAPGIYGTMGTATAANVPGARHLSVGWTDHSGNLWLFGGRAAPEDAADSLLNDLWEFNPSSGNWTWISGSETLDTRGVYGTLGVADIANAPGARSGAVAWTDSGGSFWLFGGWGQDSTGTSLLLNDLWEFDPTTRIWTWVGGSNTAGATGVYGTQGIAATGNVPGARQSPAVWTDSKGNFWLLGGSSNESGSFNDLWQLNPTTKMWVWISGAQGVGNVPSSYGTQGVASSSNSPGTRGGVGTWTDSDGNLWLFGGGVGLGQLNDLWQFNPTTGMWTWISGSATANASGSYGTQGVPAPTNMPGDRALPITWTDGSGNFWLFGGTNTYEFFDFNDLWLYR